MAHATTQLPPLYQPGQTVRLVVYLHTQGPQGLTLPLQPPLRVDIKDPYSHLWLPLSGERNLSSQTRSRQYQISVKAGGQEIAGGGFRVADFHPPEFTVSLETPGTSLNAQAQAAALQADYPFGTPIAGGKAKVQVEQHRSSFTPASLEGFAVDDLPPTLQERAAQQDHDPGQPGDLAGHPGAGRPDPVNPSTPARPADGGRAGGLGTGGNRAQQVHSTSRGPIPGAQGPPSLAQAGQSVSLEMKAATFDDQPASPSRLKSRLTARYGRRCASAAPAASTAIWPRPGATRSGSRP
ncbi:hypothetical protein DFAR_1100013 [Desulfarculales bacterium]